MNTTTPGDGHSNIPQTIKTHAHALPPRQPLMLVNSRKSGRLGRGCDNYKTY